VRRSAANEFFGLASKLCSGDHLCHDGWRSEAISLASERRIGYARHRRQEDRRSDLDISNSEHETVSPILHRTA
jgi:hypothetical protein